MINSLFGENLRKLRKEKNLTQKQLAEHLGVTARTIGYYESGQRFPSPETINRIADFFDVSLDWLFGRTNIRTPIMPIMKISEKADNYNNDLLNEEDYISVEELKEFLNQKKKGPKVKGQ